MKKLLLTGTALAILFSPALAADLPTKAAPVPFITGYPYGSNGLFAGLTTEAGGGSVVGSVPGVAPASLTTTSASVGGTVGWAWGSKGSMFAYSIQGDFLATNFNGANAGFSVAGPLTMDQTFMVWTPISTIQSAFSLLNIPNPFASIPPFPTAAGLTGSNVQAGFGGGVTERDMTLAYLGVGSNKVFSIEPHIKFALMEQLSNGSAVQEFIKVNFPTKGILFGAQQATATPSTEVRVGASVLW